MWLKNNYKSIGCDRLWQKVTCYLATNASLQIMKQAEKQEAAYRPMVDSAVHKQGGKQFSSMSTSGSKKKCLFKPITDLSILFIFSCIKDTHTGVLCMKRQ